jgi:hypothetical protein
VTIRQELLEEFSDLGKGDFYRLSENGDGDSPLGNLRDDMREEE